MTELTQIARIRFLFIGEGNFDDHLVTHLRQCCILAGASEAEGITIPFSRLSSDIGRTVAEKVAFALRLEPNVNLLFLHRDADSTEPNPRYKEIHEAICSVEDAPEYVAVIPVQETEAWLLLDEPEIRRVADNPRGTIELDIPSAQRVENISNPKEHLHEVILRASEHTGRRYKKTKQKVPQKCQLILDELDPKGPVCEIPSWKQMFSDLESALERIKTG